MKTIVLICGLIWAASPTVGWAAGVTEESESELSATLDADGDGMLDVLLLDRATGIRRVGIQQSDGAFAWLTPEATGLNRLSALSSGHFSTASPAEGFALAAADWNRVLVFEKATGPGVPVPVPGLGPSLTVALDLNGAAALDDLAVGTSWNNPPEFMRLAAVVWDGTAGKLRDQLAGPGSLSQGNRLRFKTGRPFAMGAIRQNDTASDFATWYSGDGALLSGPVVPDLPIHASWAWGEFGPSHQNVLLIYEPGRQTISTYRPDEDGAGAFRLTPLNTFSLEKPIDHITVVPDASGALLVLILDGGSSVETYDFAGDTAPVLRQRLPSSELRFSLVAGLGNGNFLLLQGPFEKGSPSSAWQRWDSAGKEHQQRMSGQLPSLSLAQARGNVLIFSSDPAATASPSIVRVLHAGEWSTRADLGPNTLSVVSEGFRSSTSGLGHPTTYSLTPRPGERYAAVNQTAATESIAILQAPTDQPATDITFDPPGGAYALKDSPLEVHIRTPSEAPIFFRTNSASTWLAYNSSRPVRLRQTTTLAAYVQESSPSPIYTATFFIAPAAAIAVPQAADLNGDGVSDAWADAFGANDPASDPDRDGASNRDEYLAGTDPLDPKSSPSAEPLEAHLRVRAPAIDAPPGTVCEILWPANLVGDVLEAAPDLGPIAVWREVPGPILVEGDERVYAHLSEAAATRQFFRLRLREGATSGSSRQFDIQFDNVPGEIYQNRPTQMSVQVANHGRPAPTNTRLHWDLPGGTDLLDVHSTVGSVHTNSGGVTLDLENLPLNANAVLTITLRPTQTNRWDQPFTLTSSANGLPFTETAYLTNVDVRPPPPLPATGSLWSGDLDTRDVIRGFQGNFVGSENYVVGKIGMAFQLNGQRIAIPDTAPFRAANGSFTIAAWVRFAGTSAGANQQAIFAMPSPNPDYPAYTLDYNSQLLAVRLYANGSTVSEGVPWQPPAQTWHHVAGTFDGETIALYIDGEEMLRKMVRVPSGGVTFSTDQSASIGANVNRSFLFGALDEVYVNNTALTAAAIQALFQGVTPTE